ncbi:EPIDERMAL PATTERNING FACTOR-like protein 4 [Rhodamnia argentea]|uniref:Epidermal patterning factor-like protein n=1 Tax=Rhodamnia argentea TaxID=178133 RepID=A0A8B8Q8P4_9MYRT|nr:EPIDERMAL PATTERNING FACTOR-like protein 4 [Rhodamnia argentea]
MSAPRHRRHPSTAALTALALLLFASASAAISVTRQLVTTTTTTTTKNPRAAGGGTRKIAHNSWPLAEPTARRRLLAGPGSSPPTCRAKCGRCSPCKPVHVPIHPGLSLPLEYYPEAWRCKCGSKLFMP